jgi:hypothetical protein
MEMFHFLSFRFLEIYFIHKKTQRGFWEAFLQRYIVDSLKPKDQDFDIFLQTNVQIL